MTKNFLWNLSALGLPLIAAFFAIPVLVDGLGTERFGVLTLVWMITSYMSLFDLGLGRALTQMVARKVGEGRREDVPPLVWTSVALLAAIGAAVGIGLAAAGPWLVRDAIGVPEALCEESIGATRWLAALLPFLLAQVGMRGALEGLERFDVASVVRLPLSVLTFMGPALILPWSRSLDAVVAVLFAVRALGAIAMLFACRALVPVVPGAIAPRAVPLLVRFGSWMTVSNVVSPLMNYLDRFFIGALSGVAVVAYYTTPYEMVTKLTIWAGALSAVLFPAFSSAFAAKRERVAPLFAQGTAHVFVVMFPACFLVVGWAGEGLHLWLGPEFAANSARVLQLLAAGVFLNTLAYIPFALVQGVGRPDITAKLHLAELPAYLAVLYLLLGAFGIEGAAIGWALRAGVDAALLFAVSTRFAALPARTIARAAVGLAAALVALWAAAAILPRCGLPLRIAVSAAVVGACGAAAWSMWRRSRRRAVAP